VRWAIRFLVGLALLGTPASAGAAKIVYGSDLKATANVVEAHGADSAFWNVTLQNGGATAAPANGQITSVQVKGTVLQDPTGASPTPNPMFHFQTLRPLPDGEMLVWLTSGAFFTPLGGDPQQVSTYKPVNMCLEKGDFLDFNDIGGAEWAWGNYSGMPFQIFSAVRGSSVGFYSKHGGTMNGSQWRPLAVNQGEELLMRMTLGTGPDATSICPGGYAQHVYRGVDLHAGQTAPVRGSAARVKVTCPWPTYGACQGTLKGTAKVNGHKVSFPKTAFKIAHGNPATVMLQVPSSASQAAQAGLRVHLVASSHDDPLHDKRDRWPQFTPVQSKVNKATITIQ
jgi:hypothetical protein